MLPSILGAVYSWCRSFMPLRAVTGVHSCFFVFVLMFIHVSSCYLGTQADQEASLVEQLAGTDPEQTLPLRSWRLVEIDVSKSIT